MVNITRIGASVPENNYNQDEVRNILGYADPKIKAVFSNTGIKKRHFVINENQKLPIIDTAEYYKIYSREALKLSVDCIKKLRMDNYKDIDQIIFVSSTGMLCPGLGFHLVREFGFRENIEVLNLVGHGCNGVFWGIQTAMNFLINGQNKRSLVVSVETSSITCYVDGSFENVIANAIFSDGAACVLLENSAAKLEILDQINLTKAHSMDLLGFRNRHGTLRVNLSKEVPSVIKKYAKKMVNEMLDRNRIRMTDISSWVIHPGGNSIMEVIEQEFNFENGELESSWKVYEEYGNMSSPTVFFVLQEELKKFTKGYMVMMGFGPGLSLNAILLKK